MQVDAAHAMSTSPVLITEHRDAATFYPFMRPSVKAKHLAAAQARAQANGTATTTAAGSPTIASVTITSASPGTGAAGSASAMGGAAAGLQTVAINV